jgi:hypothetical protein
MEIQGYSAQPTNPAPLSTADAAEPLDNLLHSKSRILRSKLEVLASEIYTLWVAESPSGQEMVEWREFAFKLRGSCWPCFGSF